MSTGPNNTDKPYPSRPTPEYSYPAPAISPASVASTVPMYLPDPSLKGISFDQLLQQRGIRFIHQKATPCPNILTVDNNAHAPNCPFCDNNGYIHYGDKEVWGVFTGNSIEKTFEAHGVWEVGSAVVTFPTLYPDGTDADFNTFDKLIIPDFTVRLTELKEYEPRSGSIQELRYPIQSVSYASSIHKDTIKIYQVGVDFNINSKGQIEWLYGKEPAFDPVTGHGEVITWSYYAFPVYLVMQLLRELRITQEFVNGKKVARKLPQQCLVRRDFLPGKAETVA